MKTYLLSLVMFLVIIPSLAVAENRKLVPSGPPGKPSTWMYVSQKTSEPKASYAFGSNTAVKKNSSSRNGSSRKSRHYK